MTDKAEFHLRVINAKEKILKYFNGYLGTQGKELEWETLKN